MSASKSRNATKAIVLSSSDDEDVNKQDAMGKQIKPRFNARTPKPKAGRSSHQLAVKIEVESVDDDTGEIISESPIKQEKIDDDEECIKRLESEMMENIPIDISDDDDDDSDIKTIAQFFNPNENVSKLSSVQRISKATTSRATPAIVSNKIDIDMLRKSFDSSDIDDDEENYINILANILHCTRKQKKTDAIVLDSDNSCNEVPVHKKSVNCRKHVVIKSEVIETNAIKTEPIETEITEPKPVETEATQGEPIKTESIETEPIETEPIETEPIETEAVETATIKFKPIEMNSIKIDCIKTLPNDVEIMEPFKIDENKLLKMLDRLSLTTTSIADRMLEVEMRNQWGRVRLEPVVTTKYEVQLETCLEYWKVWRGRFSYRDSPLMYKCYICPSAWWHLMPFKEHIKAHKDADLRMDVEYYGNSCHLIMYEGAKPNFRSIPILGNCWKCGEVYKKHFVSGKMIRNTYNCDACPETFLYCQLLREHKGECSKYLLHYAEANDIYKLTMYSCNVCKYKVTDMDLLHKHLIEFHSVRSDVPILSSTRTCAHCTQTIVVQSYHTCPSKMWDYSCLYCERKFQTKTMLTLHRSNLVTDHPCKVCNVTLPMSCMEIRHMVRHSSNFCEMYKCLVCRENILYYDVHTLRTHINLCHTGYSRPNYELMLIPRMCISADMDAEMEVEEVQKIEPMDTKHELDDEDLVLEIVDTDSVSNIIVPTKESPVISSSDTDEDVKQEMVMMKKHCYKCSLCGATGSRAKIKRHKCHKWLLNNFHCTPCSATFRTISGYVKHLPRHGYLPRCCPHCTVVFMNYSTLSLHVRKETRAMYVNVRRYDGSGGTKSICGLECKQCGKPVAANDIFNHWESHIITAVSAPKQSSDEEDSPPDSDSGDGADSDGPNKPLSARKLKIAIDGLLTTSKSKMKTITSNNCRLCDRPPFGRKNDAKRHIIHHLLNDTCAKRPLSKAYQCQICESKLSTSRQYTFHMRKHGGLPVFACSVCRMTFSDSSNFAKHRKGHSGVVRACRLCARRFISHKALLKHMEDHKNNPPVACNLCAAVFHTETDLKKHKRLFHDKETPKYSCMVCKKRFMTLKHQWEHMWTKHRMRRRKNDCSLCKTQYRTNHELKAHMKEHHPVKTVKCKLCCEEFQNNEALNTHKIRYHGILNTDTEYAELRRRKQYRYEYMDASPED